MLLEILEEIRLKKMLKLIEEGQFAEVWATLDEPEEWQGWEVWEEGEGAKLSSRIAYASFFDLKLLAYGFYAYCLWKPELKAKVYQAHVLCSYLLLGGLSPISGTIDLCEYHLKEALKLDPEDEDGDLKDMLKRVEADKY
ncbi:hypothetical protein SapgrDRAFT_1559 [Saprospira grandis DSM 2844]|uniref:Uncharacterized protein n=1 Tax=Saprospira grandis DSM 2844 TaxID=694433 RepID=J1I3I5_9BACT|nr:hypothetical protein [Saprospira grandis]EJF53270.1 hypothetical protein SapgrDRAFT_1559 [Saprospira grandis DSM 2844]